MTSTDSSPVFNCDNDEVWRRVFLFSFLPIRAALATEPKASVRGKLHTSEDPVMELASGKKITLTGDADTLGVLRDERLNDSDFEALGRPQGDGRFDVDRIHTRSMFVHRGGKRLMVTYWCEVCYIRTYTPGKCWCCQKNTDLDLRETLDGR
jgi:hypothetical protein